jgi:hypothetical protein
VPPRFTVVTDFDGPGEQLARSSRRRGIHLGDPGATRSASASGQATACRLTRCSRNRVTLILDDLRRARDPGRDEGDTVDGVA